MSTEIIKSFNSILESFLLQTSSMVGTTYHFQFQKLIKANSLIPIQHASEHMILYKDQILNKDESYFTNENNYMDKINTLNTQNIENSKILNEIMRLKFIYYELDNESKENVWSILQALLQLSIEYNEIKNK
jgi:hypothetical protein